MRGTWRKSTSDSSGTKRTHRPVMKAERAGEVRVSPTVWNRYPLKRTRDNRAPRRRVSRENNRRPATALSTTAPRPNRRTRNEKGSAWPSASFTTKKVVPQNTVSRAKAPSARRWARRSREAVTSSPIPRPLPQRALQHHQGLAPPRGIPFGIDPPDELGRGEAKAHPPEGPQGGGVVLVHVREDARLVLLARRLHQTGEEPVGHAHSACSRRHHQRADPESLQGQPFLPVAVQVGEATQAARRVEGSRRCPHRAPLSRPPAQQLAAQERRGHQEPLPGEHQERIQVLGPKQAHLEPPQPPRPHGARPPREGEVPQPPDRPPRQGPGPQRGGQPLPQKERGPCHPGQGQNPPPPAQGRHPPKRNPRGIAVAQQRGRLQGARGHHHVRDESAPDPHQRHIAPGQLLRPAAQHLDRVPTAQQGIQAPARPPQPEPAAQGRGLDEVREINRVCANHEASPSRSPPRRRPSGRRTGGARHFG
ncbi:conserved hypothetical protein [Stigmatella aurantiaca DW4/3-1]|uniref:Uncharacterized protein n=1 Tax=Stigmatella aurantiaca (strain DW4/3-1) TaxID=378806 RepID=Q09C72_STIAD|nr:conserved hypothetical protein [Stigmatella aurantiaca DW4/3-1]